MTGQKLNLPILDQLLWLQHLFFSIHFQLTILELDSLPTTLRKKELKKIHFQLTILELDSLPTTLRKKELKKIHFQLTILELDSLPTTLRKKRKKENSIYVA